jgi:hypothetical protein
MALRWLVKLAYSYEFYSTLSTGAMKTTLKTSTDYLIGTWA